MALTALNRKKEYKGKDRDFSNSRVLDVHVWSEYPEVNDFINEIYDYYFSTDVLGNKRIKKKHLKVVLLDLYVAWDEDSTSCIGVHMSPKAYSNGQVSIKGRNRFNETHIKPVTIDIVLKLIEVGLIHFKSGKYFENVSYTTRIWASDKLIKRFEDAKFGIFDLHYLGEDKKREYITLRDENKQEFDWKKDTPAIKKMRNVLKDYNALLEKTFIDIGSLEKPEVIIPPKKKWTWYEKEGGKIYNEKKKKWGEWKENKPTTVTISQRSKFTGRVFNNKKWSDGGRFYGGFWQRIKSGDREKILINNRRTVEIDFSALHIILAYSKKKIDYWSKTDEDPYQLNIPEINNPDDTRDIIKQLLLMSLNAKTEESAFTAFRNAWDYKLYEGYKFPNKTLSRILGIVKQSHSEIADMICNNAGIELMNVDSKITEYIIKEFTATDTPVLSIHDSYIVQFGDEDRLEQTMRNAFYAVTGAKEVTLKFNKNITQRAWNYTKFLDRNYYLDTLKNITNPATCEGYKKRMVRHNRYFEIE